MHAAHATVYHLLQLPPHVEPMRDASLAPDVKRFHDCGICDARYSVARTHCPFCGAQRMFAASHSYQPYRIEVLACNPEAKRQLVRAFNSTFCADENSIADDFEGDASYMQGRLVR